MRKLITILTLLTILAGCSQSDDRTQSISSKDGSFSAVVPKDMHELKGLNNDANMQYGSLESGITFMVIQDRIADYRQMIDKNLEDLKVMELFDRSKTDDIYGIEGYTFLVTQNLMNHSETAQVKLGQTKDTVVNGLPGKWTNYTIKDSGEKSYVELCVLKGSEKYYQVYSMCALRKKADNVATMQAMISSFREN